MSGAGCLAPDGCLTTVDFRQIVAQWKGSPVSKVYFSTIVTPCSAAILVKHLDSLSGVVVPEEDDRHLCLRNVHHHTASPIR